MHFVEAKSILSPKNGMNLYRGCQHGCIYCDSRSRCYQMDHDFEDIAVKQNALMLLEQSLKRKRHQCMIATGSMSDPYMPLELQLGYMRQALTLIDQYGFGFSCITKSSQVLRDLDLLVKINQQARCVVQMTLTTADEALCRKVEPNVSTTRERFETLCQLRDAGIPTVVWLCPILPWINDTAENISQILDDCIVAGVSGVLCFGMGLTLREGNREYFYQQLDQKFPGLKDRYIQTFGNQYVVSSPNNAALMRLYHRKCAEHGILHDNDAIFAFLNQFPEKQAPVQQLSLF